MAEQVPRGGPMGCIARPSGVWQLRGVATAERSEPCAVVAVMCEWSGS